MTAVDALNAIIADAEQGAEYEAVLTDDELRRIFMNIRRNALVLRKELHDDSR